MTQHVDGASLLAYLDDDPIVDRERIAAHLAECGECRTAQEELRALTMLFRDGEVRALSEHGDDGERAAGRSALDAVLRQQHDEDLRAEAFFKRLVELPVEEWPSTLEAHRHEQTERLVRRIIREVEVELNRDAARALRMLDAVEVIAVALDEQPTYRALGDCYKHRANAQRHLGDYPTSLEAVDAAIALYRLVRHGEFDVGQALYTRAATLFKMTRFAEALSVLAEATTILQPFGESMPLAKVRMLEAAIRFDQGDTANAERIWLDVIPTLELFEEQHELALVRENLAECTFRNGRPLEALAQAEAAAEGFRLLGIDADRIRSEWTIAAIRLALREDDALDRLYAAADAFEAHNMIADAAFVRLDIAEELLKRRDWHRAAATARQLAVLFTKAGVTLASVLAVSYLAEAVEGERATPELVQYVREYVTADDASRAFDPPGGYPGA